MRGLKQGMTASHQHRTSIEIKSIITGACGPHGSRRERSSSRTNWVCFKIGPIGSHIPSHGGSAPWLGDTLRIFLGGPGVWGSSEPLLLSPESLPVRITAVCCGKDWGTGTRLWKFTVGCYGWSSGGFRGHVQHPFKLRIASHRSVNRCHPFVSFGDSATSAQKVGQCGALCPSHPQSTPNCIGPLVALGCFGPCLGYGRPLSCGSSMAAATRGSMLLRFQEVFNILPRCAFDWSKYRKNLVISLGGSVGFSRIQSNFARCSPILLRCSTAVMSLHMSSRCSSCPMSFLVN